MNVITVIPLTRSKILGELSYFTASDVPIGAIVSVPIRSKNVHAIVTSSQPVSDLKSDIKGASYTMKKLGKVRATAFFPAHFMDACRSLADYYSASVGAIINSLFPEGLLEEAKKIAAPGTPSSVSLDETYVVQGDDADRLSSWRSLIRQEFARKKSVAFYVPTVEDARTLSSALVKGIEGYLFILHSALGPKKIAEEWQRIATLAHPVVVIATGSFSLLPRTDIETIVIERENGRGWVSPRHPYLDLRRAIELIARKNCQTVYIADSLLRAETLKRHDDHEVSEGSPFKWRSISNARESLIDMRKKPGPDTGERTPFRTLSHQLEDLIKLVREENSHLFILTARRGTAPVSVCGDCGTIVSCNNCGAPVVLHTSIGSGKNFFMCHLCGERRSADEACVACTSWRLMPLGVGIDRVRDEIEERFPGTEVFKIDADTTKTDKQIASVLEKFRARPGSILLGTEMALLHLSAPVDHAAIASLDSLFALPDFRINERIMYTLVRLRSLAARTFLVQTRKPEEKVFEYGLKGNLSDFHRATADDRKRFSYPPYSTLIKVSVEGKKDAIARDMAAYVKLLEPREMDIFPAFTANAKGGSVIHGLMKIDPAQWPDAEVVNKLRSLPPNVKVKVDPESLL